MKFEPPTSGIYTFNLLTIFTHNIDSIATQLQAQLELLITEKCYNQDRYYSYPSGRSPTASTSLHDIYKAQALAVQLLHEPHKSADVIKWARVHDAVADPERKRDERLTTADSLYSDRSKACYHWTNRPFASIQRWVMISAYKGLDTDLDRTLLDNPF
jgi:hypothetical protein